MRCNSCNKFASYGDANIEEVEEPGIAGATFTAEYSVTLTCADCSQDLKAASLRFEEELGAKGIDDPCVPDEQCPYCSVAKPEKEICPKCETDFSSDDHEWEFSIETEGSDRSEGKGRGMKTFYGVHVTGTAVCKKCTTEIELDFTADAQASAFEEVQ